MSIKAGTLHFMLYGVCVIWSIFSFIGPVVFNLIKKSYFFLTFWCPGFDDWSLTIYVFNIWIIRVLMICCAIFDYRFLTSKRKYHVLEDSEFQLNIICIWDLFNKKNARHSCCRSCNLVYCLSYKYYLLLTFTFFTKEFCNITSNYICFSLQKPPWCLWTFICGRGACSWRESFNLLQARRILQYSPATCHEKCTLSDWLNLSAFVKVLSLFFRHRANCILVGSILSILFYL